MSLDIASLSEADKTRLLLQVAHVLTVSARSTYQTGTNEVAEPTVLRGYNEIQHRVTGALLDRVWGDSGMPLETVIQMLKEFGEEHHRSAEVEWVLRLAAERLKVTFR